MFETRFSSLLAVLLSLSFLLIWPGPAATASPPLASAAAARLDESFGLMPLYFVENRGQLDDRVAYHVLGGPAQVYFAADGVTFALVEPDAGGSRDRNRRGEAFLDRPTATALVAPGAGPGAADDLAWNPSPLHARAADYAAPRQRWAVKLDFVGANPHARPVGEDQTGAVVSYFMGAPDQWHAGLPTYARVVYRDLWPGIDLAYYGRAGRLKYDFLVHPGADPAQIRLRYRGAASVSLNAAGQLDVTTPLGGFVDDAPIAWQETNGQRAPVDVAFDVETHHAPSRDRNGTGATRTSESSIGDSQSFGFSFGGFDRSRPLVIDPAMLLYCGYIGGSGYDFGSGIAVDGSDNAYVTGTTTSIQDSFPETGGPDQTQNGRNDAFVAKVNPSGMALVYAGYIGGESDDYGYGIAVDGDGNAYVTGETGSKQDTFPVIGGPDPTFNGEWDAFVAKVNASGVALVYAGYIGGLAGDVASGIAVDGAGNAYVTGNTASTQAQGFPVVGGPGLTYNGGTYDAFIAKVSASGAALVYAGYIGGSGDDVGYGIDVGGSGNAYVTGWTNSAQDTFPVIGGPSLTYNGSVDAFVAKVSASGTALVYAGYIGGTGGDSGNGIVVDGAGNAYVTGSTASTQATFPVVGGPGLTYNGGNSDAFVAKVSASGAALVYAGYIGGSGGDYGHGIAVDGSGNACIVGYTASAQDTFPVSSGPDLTYNGGAYDAFVAKVSASGAALVYAGYIGGSRVDVGNGIAVDGAGKAYVTGTTTSSQSSFPVAGGPGLTYSRYDDAFVAKVFEASSAAYLPVVQRGN